MAAPIAFTHQHFTPAVADFLAHYPDIEVQLIPRSTPSDLVAEEIDLAIRVGKVDPSLVARRLDGLGGRGGFAGRTLAAMGSRRC